MSYITTKVSPCVRYVLVRNVQCKKHLKQQKGDMEGKPGSNSNLTEEGDKMAQALENLIDYLEKRPYCVPDDKVLPRSYSIVVDGKSKQHYDTSRYLRQKHRDIYTIYTTNIKEHIKRDLINADHINICIVFTDATTIREICQVNISEKLHLGAALGSCSIFDIVPDNRIFVHEFGSLAALQYGGYDTSKLFWWNNDK